jgi:hypothetical protein
MEIRKSSRGILLNENNEVFLIKETFRNLRDGQTLWVTPEAERKTARVMNPA